MRYETMHSLSEEDFKRSIGVQRSTFDIMRQVIEPSRLPKKLRRIEADKGYDFVPIILFFKRSIRPQIPR